MKTLSFLALIISLVGISICSLIFYFDEETYYEGYFYIIVYIVILYLSIKTLFYDDEF